jgi:hypothetical protein
MAAGTPNFQGVAKRNLLVTAIDISAAGSNYKIIGRRAADSTIAFNTAVTTETDVLGITDTTIDNMQETQPFTFALNSADYDFSGWALDIYRRRAFNEFSGIKALQIHAFEGAAGSYTATEFDNCTVEMTELGGAGEEGRINMGVTLHFGGEVRQGTVNTAKLGSVITFTPTI